MNIIRQLLFDAEKTDGPLPVRGSLESYQVELMIDAGLIEGRVSQQIGATARESFIHRLTWKGHDFLDGARNEDLWQKAQDKFLRPAASWTFDILLEWLKEQIRNNLLS
jgi:hypothetical protein